MDSDREPHRYDDLTGKVAVVTGSTKGVGRVIATFLADLGMKVVGCSRSALDDPTRIEFESSSISHVEVDVRDPDQVHDLVDYIVRNHGSVDLLVNNAGGSPHSLVADSSPNYLSKIISLNLIAPLLVAKAVNEIMQGQDTGGVIVNIGSVSGTRPSPGTAAYGAAKAGLENLTKTLAVEWAPKVRVNYLACGPIITEQAHLHYGDSEGVERVGATIPMGRLASATDVVRAVAWLASLEASYITGASLSIHGGGERPTWMEASTADL